MTRLKEAIPARSQHDRARAISPFFLPIVNAQDGGACSMVLRVPPPPRLLPTPPPSVAKKATAGTVTALRFDHDPKRHENDQCNKPSEADRNDFADVHRGVVVAIPVGVAIPATWGLRGGGFSRRRGSSSDCRPFSTLDQIADTNVFTFPYKC